MNNVIVVATFIVGVVIGGLVFSAGIGRLLPNADSISIMLMIIGIGMIAAFVSWEVVLLASQQR